MRNKKANWLPWVIGTLIIAAFIFVLVREVPMPGEHVEQAVEVRLN